MTNTEKLMYQLFVGKVADLIGIPKAAELLAQSRKEIKQANLTK